MVNAVIGREEFIKENLGLVHSVCHRFAGRGIEYDDLYQAGCIGLIKAVDAFDQSRGFAFSTYAVPKISGEIRRFLRDDGSVKVSRSIKERAAVIKLRQGKSLRKIPALSGAWQGDFSEEVWIRTTSISWDVSVF